ncbi:NagC family transcriptional regulator [Bifidobacterium goeldii]|uniref:NagC family transcriptional regulator n=1 Tax=Bifidobacterium goeldii TaxID=2306975 RepID=A0A430FN39_9BIFI|nr:ROK family transcriptional regulator [Bifidobacterium goeldii]RSX54250.1 NagC family transcriptional regulator [Bifidobacterium goeldii]
MGNMAGTATSIASVSESNRSRIMHHLYQHGVSSRAQIAKALELTPAAITKITAKLLDAGVIEETGDLEGSKNRRSIGLKLDKNAFHVIAVKFARSLVQIGVFDLAGTPLTVRDLPQITEDTISETVNLLHAIINDMIHADSAIVAVGMAVPGPYLRHIGRTAVVSSMRGWQRVNFLDEFGGAFPVPVFVEQDARAGAFAQYLFDPSVADDGLAYYLIGEGVGLGVIDHGSMINGAMGAATEIGHVSIDIHGKPCECGNVGCLERYCSTPAIHEMIVNEGDLIDNASQLTHTQAARTLFAMAKHGNERAIQLVRQVGQYIGFGCVTIFNAFNPAQIVIGDIVSEAGPLLLDEVKTVVNQHVIPELNEATTITLSELPADAALGGGAAVAINQFLEHPSMFFELT